MRKLLWSLAAVAAVAVTGGQSQAAFITTIPAWDGASAVQPFGEPDTATYGQTITVGATDTFLTDFSFRVNTQTAAPTQFAGYVMEWNAGTSRATGPVLFNSGLMLNNNTGLFNTVGVTTNVNLAANTQYVLFLSVLGFTDGNNDASIWGQTQGSNSYAGGEFVFINTFQGGVSIPALTTNAWTTGFLGQGGDLAFTANLTPNAPSAVPAPAGLLLGLLGLGSCGIGGLARRRVAAKA